MSYLMQLVCDACICNENFSARKRRTQSLYVKYIGHKNMSLFSFCLGIFKQLVFSNVPPKEKYLFISGKP